MKFFIHVKNPENYAIKKGIPDNRLEKHVQGTIVTIWLSFITFYCLVSPFLFHLDSFPPIPGYKLLNRVFADICVQKVNELSQYQMVWVDEDGFLLRPLGIDISTIMISLKYL
jgi:hypothetical protein